MNKPDKAKHETDALKGQLIGVGCFLSALVRTLPPETVRTLMEQFDIELAEAKAALTFSPDFSDEAITGLDDYVRTWDSIRGRGDQQL